MFHCGDEIREKSTGRFAKVEYGGWNSVIYLISFSDGKRYSISGYELEKKFELTFKR